MVTVLTVDELSPEFDIIGGWHEELTILDIPDHFFYNWNEVLFEKWDLLEGEYSQRKRWQIGFEFVITLPKMTQAIMDFKALVDWQHKSTPTHWSSTNSCRSLVGHYGKIKSQCYWNCC